MGDLSFPPSHRLLKSAEFDKVFISRELSIYKDSLLLLAMRNELSFNRLGMIIGKKSLPRARDRNSTKRQLRESFRHLDFMGLDIVALVKPGFSADHRMLKLISSTFSDLKQKAIG